MSEETGYVSVLETLGDPEARRLLASVSDRPRSAKDLASEHDLSLPTVYRRVDILREHGLVSSKTFVTDEGTHYKRYEATFRRAVVELDGGRYDVRLELTENAVDGRDEAEETD